jgi:dephospho-CoA kinase
LDIKLWRLQGTGATKKHHMYLEVPAVKVYALTGGIASGKSTVTEWLRARGYLVIDADEIVKDLYGQGEPVYNAIVNTFGSVILNPKGEIDRLKLGRIVFSDEESRLRLNQATHPIIEAQISDKIKAAKTNGLSMVFVDLPLFLEKGRDPKYDAVILVYVDPEIQMKRLMARNQLSKEDAKRRIESQMPLREKRAHSDYIIDNNGTVETLEAQLESLLKKLKASGSPEVFKK